MKNYTTLLSLLVLLACAEKENNLYNENFNSAYQSAKQKSSIDLTQKAIEAAHLTDNPAHKARAYFLRGYLQQADYLYHEAVESYLEALKHYRKTENLTRMSYILANLNIL